MFAAFHEVEKLRVRESVGLPFEGFAAGQIFHHRPGVTVSQQDNVDEALATLNQAMIHYDENYAAKTEFGRPLVVSTLTLQRAVGLGWKTFGRRRRITGFSSIRLTSPVFGGDTLYARTRIISVGQDPEDPDCGTLDCEATMSRPDGADVAHVRYGQSVYRDGRGPLPRLGY
ncbi:MAG: transcription regulatory protein [Alphaproteobacteria bacterium]|nr:MAG: transcription regulatory protein [Alphaproteobacteria bacterium]